MKNTKELELTEMEGLALALIERAGEMTAYAVKEALAASPSRFWSGSTGAVYPLMKRLAARGLLQEQATKTGRRASVTYRLTRAGKAQLNRWIGDTERAIDPGIDPLRLRLVFLSLLSTGEQQRFISSMMKELEAAISQSPFSGGDASPENRNHHIWMKARQTAFLQCTRQTHN